MNEFEKIEVKVEEIRMLEIKIDNINYIIKLGRANDQNIFIKIININELPPQTYQKIERVSDFIYMNKYFEKYKNDIQSLYEELYNIINKKNIKIIQNFNELSLILIFKEKTEINIEVKLNSINLNPNETNEILCKVVSNMNKEIIKLKTENNEIPVIKQKLNELINENNKYNKEINFLKSNIEKLFKALGKNKIDNSNIENNVNEEVGLSPIKNIEPIVDQNPSLNNFQESQEDKQEIKDILKNFDKPASPQKKYQEPQILNNKNIINCSDKKKYTVEYKKMNQSSVKIKIQKEDKITDKNVLDFNDKYSCSITGEEDYIYLYQKDIDNIGLKLFCKLDLSNLQKLELPNNIIIDISPLENINCLNLISLNLSNNNIEEITVFRRVKFKYLEILYLGSNKIKDISVFKDNILKNLKELSLYKNNININADRNKIIISDLKSRIGKFYI